MACERNLAIFSNVLFSCPAYPFTVSTRLGIRSCRRFSCTSMSDQAESQRTRSCPRLLYIPISRKPITTRTPRMIQAAIGIFPRAEARIMATVSQAGSPRNRGHGHQVALRDRDAGHLHSRPAFDPLSYL